MTKLALADASGTTDSRASSAAIPPHAVGKTSTTASQTLDTTLDHAPQICPSPLIMLPPCLADSRKAGDPPRANFSYQIVRIGVNMDRILRIVIFPAALLASSIAVASHVHARESVFVITPSAA